MKAKAKKGYKIQRLKATNKEYWWRLKSPNGQTISGPGETFKTNTACENSIVKSAAGMMLAINPQQMLKVLVEIYKQTGLISSSDPALGEITKMIKEFKNFKID